MITLTNKELLLLIVLMLVVGSLAGAALARVGVERSFKIQAVQHGAANWTVKPDGTTQFRWNDEKP